LTRLPAKATIPRVSNHRLAVDTDAVIADAKRWRVSRRSLFGPVLRENFPENRDIDVLVEFTPDVQYSLFNLAQLKQELELAFQWPVDIVEPAGGRGTALTSGTYSERRRTMWSSP
jgi:predicted nucleotidyltransferase